MPNQTKKEQQAQQKEQKQEEPKVTLEYSIDEVEQQIRELNEDKDVELFLKVQDGAAKYNRLVELAGIMEQLRKK